MDEKKSCKHHRYPPLCDECKMQREIDKLTVENEKLKKVVDAGNSLYDLHKSGHASLCHHSEDSEIKMKCIFCQNIDNYRNGVTK